MEKVMEILTLIQQDIQGMKTDIQDMKTDIQDMKTDMQGMKTDIAQLKTRQDETYQIVKSLEHAAQVSKAEHDKMAMDIAYIQKDVAEIKKELNFVEIVTTKNSTDIALLKAVK